MKVLKKLKKRRVVVLFFVLVIFLYGIFRSKNYTAHYTIEGVQIEESYDNKKASYRFLFHVKEKDFFIQLESKYKHSKKLIQNVEVFEKDDLFCIVPQSKSLDLYPLCLQGEEYVSYHLLQDSGILNDTYFPKIPETTESSYQNLKIYHLGDRKFYIWNYKGFYVLDKNDNKEIRLFQEDVYTLPLAIKVGDYLLLADYDSKYIFHSFYVIGSKNNKVRELYTDQEFSFDSYFLGATKKKAYFFDKKNKKEYEIYPKRLLIETISNNNQGKIYINKEWQSISLTSLLNTEQYFSDDSVSYELLDEHLYVNYDNYKIKLSNQKVKDIIYYDSLGVYYLVDDQLYFYSSKEGEVLVLSNFEWNFNYKNMIFIF